MLFLPSKNYTFQTRLNVKEVLWRLRDFSNRQSYEIEWRKNEFSMEKVEMGKDAYALPGIRGRIAEIEGGIMVHACVKQSGFALMWYIIFGLGFLGMLARGIYIGKLKLLILLPLGMGLFWFVLMTLIFMSHSTSVKKEFVKMFGAVEIIDKQIKIHEP